MSSGNTRFPVGGGEMGKRIREFDWSETGLGPISTWPETLKVAVNIILQSPAAYTLQWGMDGILIYNDAYSEFAGTRHPAALGTKVADSWPEAAAFAENVMEQCLKGASLTYTDQLFTFNRTGRTEQVLLTLHYSPVMDEDGKPAGVLAVVIENTERVKAERKQRRAEEDLKAEQQRLYDLFMQAPAMIAILRGPEHRFELANPLYTQVVGKDADIHGKTVREVFPELKDQGIPELLDSIYSSGQPYSVNELRLELEHGSAAVRQEIFFNLAYQPFRNSKGAVEGILLHGTEVTEQVNSRRMIEESEKRFRSLADTAPMYIAMADETGKAVYFNKPWLEFTGKDMSEMEGMGWLSTLHPDDAPKFENDFKEAFTEHIPINKQYRFRRADGEFRWMLAVGAPRLDDDGKFIGYYGTYTDVHDLKMAQLAVQDSEAQLRFLADSMPQQVWTAEPDGRLDYVNKQACDYFGRTAAELIDEGWQTELHPDDLARTLRVWMHSIQTGDVYDTEFRLKRSGDKTYRWHLARALPIFDDKGSIVKWFGSNTDIEELKSTKRQRDELKRIKTTLEKQRSELIELNTAKDEFISLSSHQLRTPATGVKQYISMVLGGYAGELNDAQRKFLQTAYEGNERQLSIVNDLLKVARADSGRLKLHIEKVDIVGLARDVIAEQRSKFEDKHQDVRLRHNHAAIQAPVDTSTFRMVLENLIDNAYKYTYPGKAIEINITKDKGSVRIAIADEGTGIDQADLSKLFLKFSRIDNPLSATVGGTGLGLYWVKRIITLHGGTIDVDSKPGKGTAFTITLTL